jgi:hypothetical protein
VFSAFQTKQRNARGSAISLIDEHFALLSPWTEGYYQRMVREKSGKR